MKIGFACQRITPEGDCRLAGFAAERPAEGIRDELMAKILIAQTEEMTLGVISLDLLAVDNCLVEPLREYFASKGYPKEHLLVCATHTHSGPMGLLDTSKGCLKATRAFLGEKEEARVSALLAQLREGMDRALDSMKERKLYYAKGKCPGIGANRNSRDLPGNEDLAVLKIVSREETIALVNFACHPTLLNAQSKVVSADFPGACAKALARRNVQLLFLNGSCGDISTRYTRKGDGEQETERMGTLLANHILALMEQAEPFAVSRLEVQTKTVCLKTKEPMPEPEAKELVDQCRQQLALAQNKLRGSALREVESRLEAAEAAYRYALAYNGEREYPVTVTCLQVNGHTCVFVPGELFSQLSNPLQNDTTHFIGYANGYMMYFPDVAAYDSGVYEAMSSPFARGEGEKMMQEIQNWIRKG